MTTQKLSFGLELKALSDGQFEGHGSMFGNVDLGGDIVIPGAFKASLAEHKRNGTMPQMFWMHDPAKVAGRWDEMREDRKGLYVKGTLAATALGDEMRTLLKMDAVRGLSIGYRTRESDWDDEGNRLLKAVDLWEVSLVSLPMNPLAQVTHAKSRLSASGEYVPTPREFERILRDVGCSKTVAKRICGKVFETELCGGTLPELGRRDDGNDEETEMLKGLNGLLDKIGLAVITTK